MNRWLNVNCHVIEEGSYKAVVAVLSWLKGPKARLFKQVQLQKGQVYTWEILEQEIIFLFNGNLVKQQALEKLDCMYQAQEQSIDSFLIIWEAEYAKSNIGDSQATVWLLEIHV